MNRIELENRLIEYAGMIIELCRDLPEDYAAQHLGKQLVRSGTSSALNYGEAQGAESRADFLHKIKISVKELRESMIALKILHRQSFISNTRIGPVLLETNELISILVASVKTAQRRKK